MKIIRDTEWAFRGVSFSKILNQYALNFQHKQFDDEVITLKEAKLCNIAKAKTVIVSFAILQLAQLDASVRLELMEVDPSLIQGDETCIVGSSVNPND